MPGFDAQITFCYTPDLAGTARFYEEMMGLPLALDQGDLSDLPGGGGRVSRLLPETRRPPAGRPDLDPRHRRRGRVAPTTHRPRRPVREGPGLQSDVSDLSVVLPGPERLSDRDPALRRPAMESGGLTMAPRFLMLWVDSLGSGSVRRGWGLPRSRIAAAAVSTGGVRPPGQHLRDHRLLELRTAGAGCPPRRGGGAEHWWGEPLLRRGGDRRRGRPGSHHRQLGSACAGRDTPDEPDLALPADLADGGGGGTRIDLYYVYRAQTRFGFGVGQAYREQFRARDVCSESQHRVPKPHNQVSRVLTLRCDSQSPHGLGDDSAAHRSFSDGDRFIERP